MKILEVKPFVKKHKKSENQFIKFEDVKVDEYDKKMIQLRTQFAFKTIEEKLRQERKPMQKA
tara:strand:+ start:290 stop:475 length:186 start_codon:yes stop_codon:yes gene_type:complete